MGTLNYTHSVSANSPWVALTTLSSPNLTIILGCGINVAKTIVWPKIGVYLPHPHYLLPSQTCPHNHHRTKISSPVGHHLRWFIDSAKLSLHTSYLWIARDWPSLTATVCGFPTISEISLSHRKNYSHNQTLYMLSEEGSSISQCSEWWYLIKHWSDLICPAKIVLPIVAVCGML